MAEPTGPTGPTCVTAPDLVVEAEGITFAYHGQPVVDGVTFAVPRGQFVALAGPNGSGKSTLVRLLLGLLTPSSGSVRLLGTAPARLADRWRVGFVPQRPTVAADLPATVAEVVAAGRLARSGWARRPRAVDRDAVDRALAVVGLTERAGHRASELSGGQQQRALIARALASEPELLVLDEPVAGVDAGSQRAFRDALVSRVRDAGTAVLLVSHELGAVAADLDRILVMRHGGLVFDGQPAELEATGVSLGVHQHDLPLWLEGLG